MVEQFSVLLLNGWSSSWGWVSREVPGLATRRAVKGEATMSAVREAAIGVACLQTYAGVACPPLHTS